ncbi:MAG: alcohol dehydrogenase catalytic domain-containing protein [Gemmatimonadota bacterium]|nr:alcohol dehydrogenase catalytic domain-containing protein [Gemmatimonadota bacterium]
MIGVWVENGAVTVRDDLPAPTAGQGDAVVSVQLAGLCGTDLALVEGYRDFVGIPGHEFVGIVDEGPPGWKGARVASEINVTCGSYPPESDRCKACGWGRTTHCERRTAIGIFGRDGVFAERVALPVANLHRVPVLVPNDKAVFVEPLAAAFRVLEQVDIGEGTRVVVIGPGRLGQLVARAVATTGARPTLAGRSEASLVRGRRVGIASLMTDEIEAGTYDVAVDCTGSPEGFAAARRALRPAGTLVLKSTYSSPLELDATSLAVDEIRVIGSRCGPFPRAIEALSSGTVDVEDLIDDRFPLTDAPAAFTKAAEPGVAKVLLEA